MLHQENQAIVINTGSKQGITNPPCVTGLTLSCSYVTHERWGARGPSGNPAYNAAKAAVKSLTESLAHELRENPSCNVTAHLVM